MTIGEARAFWVVAPGSGEIRGEALPQPATGEAVVRTRFSAVSRGTEALVFRGEVPPGEAARMRAPFQAGEFPAPVKYGYVSVGVVDAGPPPLAGRTVFCLHPHQTRYVVPAAALHVVPDEVPAARAVLAASMETAVNALWDGAPRVGDRIAVVGGGVVGCLVAWLTGRMPGCRVELIDVNPARAAVAAELGVAFALPGAATPDADLVFHASGAPEGLATALALAAFEATIVELSWYGRQAVAAPLGEAFHSQRLTLRASQVGAVATHQRARWSHRRRMALALALLAHPRLDALITGEGRFDDLPEVMVRLARGAGATLCHRICYD
ncbi:MAG: zinc-binding alcohol dehydrogenase [Burkholderiales bacterium]|nr:zinc-binding alcohol dehydrogenase [Burkholderiales bacterium]